MKIRATRSFTLAHQMSFAQASGDWNPLHVDPVYARRLPNGRPLVHGIHTFLWALDLALKDVSGRHLLTAARVSFPSALRVDQTVDLLATVSEGDVTIEATADSDPVLQAHLTITATNGEAPAPSYKEVARTVPDAHLFEELETVAGSRDLTITAEAAKLFPKVLSCLNAEDFALLLQLSATVGMDSPGLNSIFSSFRVERKPAASEGEGPLRFSPRRIDERFGKVDLALETPHHSGQLTAFYRPERRRQAAFTTVLEQVETGEFRNQRALIVGGSRGLGEVFAKTVAAGGGDVAVTYRSGAGDALAVVAEIGGADRKAQALRFDVLEREAWPRPFSHGPPTHVYYLATPPIFVGSRTQYSRRLEQEFAEYYVEALSRAAQSYLDCSPLCIIAPSSIAVTEVPLGMEEYANAKEAQEVWARDWMAEHRHHRVVCDRYPRLATDQTQSNALGGALDPLEFVLERVREANTAL